MVQLLDKKELMRFMASFDSDKDGVITGKEIDKAISNEKNPYFIAYVQTIMGITGLNKDSNITIDKISEILDGEVPLKDKDEQGVPSFKVDLIAYKDGQRMVNRGFAYPDNIKRADINGDGKTTLLEFMSEMVQLQQDGQEKMYPAKYDLWDKLSKGDADGNGKLTPEEVTKYIESVSPAERGALQTALNILDLRGSELTKESLEALLQKPFHLNVQSKDGEMGFRTVLFRGTDDPKDSAMRGIVLSESFFHQFDTNGDGVTYAEAINALVDAQKIAQENKGTVDPSKLPAKAGVLWHE
jgi:Ca2+-binding EF-hand superfamily protein